MKLSKKQIIDLVVIFIFGVILITSLCLMLSLEKSDPRFKGVGSYMISYNGKPATLAVHKNETIKIILVDFDENEKAEIYKAVEEFDEVIDSINYEFVDQDEDEYVQKIFIFNNIELGNNFSRTAMTIDNTNSTIKFPLFIDCEGGLSKIRDSNGTTLLSYIIKHELMHTLGFKDLYDTREIDQTIMYYTPRGQTISGLTQRDISFIKQVYQSD